MELELREITDANRDAVLALRTTPAQEQFVSTVHDSLDEAERNPQGNPESRAAYAHDRPVGFVMLIDHRHQGRGYGREVVRQVVELVRAQGGGELLTSYVPGDGSPAGFYARLGFVPRGDVDPDGEVILRLPL